MIQEDQNQMCSNGGEGGTNGGSVITRSSSSSSKKLKQKKVPQRGLGVAQLEKIRMEEQQKKDSSSSTISPTKSSPLPTVPLPNYPHSNNKHKLASKSTLPFSPPSPPSMPMNLSPNPMFRARSENFNLSLISSMNPSNGDGFQVGWPSIPVHGSVSVPKSWHQNPLEFSSDHNGEKSIFLPKLSLPYETCNVATLPDVLPRSTLSPNSLVNVSPMNLSSSVLTFPMEPPSNQSFYSNHSPFWPDEEKMMVGMKRSCPFPSDNPPIPTFHCKFAPSATHSLNRSDESTSGGGKGGTPYNLDPGIPIFRDIHSYPNAMPEPANSRKISRSENGKSHNGEFLSLAPPTIPSCFHSSRLKQFCKFDNLPYQVSIEDQHIDSRQADSGSSQQTNMFSFFPLTKLQATTSASPPPGHSSCNNEVGENIDLNLRL